MNETYTKIADAVTEGLTKAASLSMEIDLDNLKYSSWVGAFCTAGVALIIINFDKLIANSWLTRHVAFYGIITAGGLLLLGIIIGGLINLQINKTLTKLRLLTTKLMVQKVELLCKDNISDTTEVFKKKIAAVGYLEEDEQEAYKKLNEERLSIMVSYRILMQMQQILTIAGYIIIFICAIKTID